MDRNSGKLAGVLLIAAPLQMSRVHVFVFVVEPGLESEIRQEECAI